MKDIKPPTIADGIVMLYYCFDAGYEIQVGNLAKIRGKTTRKSLLTYKRLTPPYIQYEVPPLLIHLGKRRLVINDRTITASVDAKIYVFGVITIRFTLPLSSTLQEMRELSGVLTESALLRKKAISEFKKIRNDILPSIVKPRIDAEKDFEDYAIFLARQFLHPITPSELLQNYSAEIAGILRQEKGLSTFEIADALKNPLSYRETDLTLIDWNSAFIVDPESSHDIPDIIEFALIQLLELRLYDNMFDTIIDAAYVSLTSTKQRVFPFSKTLRDLSRIKLDISEILDRLMYHLKLIGDLYLAKVYETASKRFYLEQWKAAVRQKMATIESIYKEMWTRIQTTRMVILETAIVVLFIIDIILILVEFFKK
jgi:hypothetical protein